MTSWPCLCVQVQVRGWVHVPSFPSLYSESLSFGMQSNDSFGRCVDCRGCVDFDGDSDG
jgi:hypothetical protein